MSEESTVKKYAIVDGVIVLGTICTDPGFMEMLANNSVIDITNDPAAADITAGYTYENGVFSGTP